MIDLDQQCQRFIDKAVTQFLVDHADDLKTLPDSYLNELTLLRKPGCVTMTKDLKLNFGEAGGLAFVLQHGSQNYPALQFRTWLDKIVGEQITKVLEGT